MNQWSCCLWIEGKELVNALTSLEFDLAATLQIPGYDPLGMVLKGERLLTNSELPKPATRASRNRHFKSDYWMAWYQAVTGMMTPVT
ncbi:MAG: hypothetical protein M2R46_01849 [Verrucomicrobia subdivision 3 bacterium]|nr:hypothetical protein [Limisphaerales bacterium]